MEKWVKKIIEEREELNSYSYEIEPLDYENTKYKIWYKKVKDFF